MQEKRLDSAIDFPLAQGLGRVFFEHAPTEQLRYGLKANRRNRHLWVTFLDNHDMARMRARADWLSVKQALVALYTLPGIPCIYYGTEHEFTEQRQNMFYEGYYSGETKETDGRRFLQSLNRFRKDNPLFATGDVRVVTMSHHSGVLAYELVGQKERALVVFNTADFQMFYGVPVEYRGQPVLLSDSPSEAPVGENMILEPYSYRVIKLADERARSCPEPMEPRSSKLSIGLSITHIF